MNREPGDAYKNAKNVMNQFQKYNSALRSYALSKIRHFPCAANVLKIPELHEKF